MDEVADEVVIAIQAIHNQSFDYIPTGIEDLLKIRPNRTETNKSARERLRDVNVVGRQA